MCCRPYADVTAILRLSAGSKAQRTTDLHISVVTVGEIERGITPQQRHNPAFARDLAVWLDRVLAWYGDRILLVDAATARRWGQLSAALGTRLCTLGVRESGTPGSPQAA